MLSRSKLMTMPNENQHERLSYLLTYFHTLACKQTNCAKFSFPPLSLACICLRKLVRIPAAMMKGLTPLYDFWIVCLSVQEIIITSTHVYSCSENGVHGMHYRLGLCKKDTQSKRKIVVPTWLGEKSNPKINGVALPGERIWRLTWIDTCHASLTSQRRSMAHIAPNRSSGLHYQFKLLRERKINSLHLILARRSTTHAISVHRRPKTTYSRGIFCRAII